MKIHSHTEDKHCTTESMKATRRLLFTKQQQLRSSYYIAIQTGLDYSGEAGGTTPYYSILFCRLKSPLPDAIGLNGLWGTSLYSIKMWHSLSFYCS